MLGRLRREAGTPEGCAGILQALALRCGASRGFEAPSCQPCARRLARPPPAHPALRGPAGTPACQALTAAGANLPGHTRAACLLCKACACAAPPSPAVVPPAYDMLDPDLSLSVGQTMALIFPPDDPGQAGLQPAGSQHCSRVPCNISGQL